MPSQAAYLLVDGAGRALASQHDAVIDTPLLAGSVMKAVTLVAARNIGVLDATTRVECTRALRVEGHVLDCIHPPLGRAVGAHDALAQSCNRFVVAVAARMSRSALSGAAVSLGLPPVPETASLPLAALGLEGARATPRRWLAAFRALVARERRTEASFLLEGLREAARTGSAGALGARGIEAFAKTGTAPMPGGGTAGIVVVLTTDLTRALVVVAPGGSGRDAAEIAARVLAPRRGSSLALARPGHVRVGIAGAHGYDVRVVPIADYVAGVVDAEAAPDATPGARRTLAIVARTWAARHRGRHAADGFDVCDLTHCQVYRPARQTGQAAEAETRGLVLAGADGEPIDAEYSASCGGRLESGADPAGIDHGDAWRAELDHRALLEALRPAGVAGGRLEHIAVVARTSSGRARTVTVRTDRDYEIDAEQFRLAVGRTLGWQHLGSTWFDVAPSARGFVFAGRGRGHGRGMCVRGAAAMDARGDSVETILKAYFPGASPSATRDALEVRLDLPASVAHRGAALEAVVRGHASTMAIRLGRGVPPRIDVIVHPTLERFRRTTGLGWWAGARTRGSGIDLVPLDVLERSGRLDVTLRHELVHVLTADRLDGRPRWVHEGLAAVVSRETLTADVPHPLACPTDDEFVQARAEALPVLYARAAACVRAELARRSWTDIGATR